MICNNCEYVSILKYIQELIFFKFVRTVTYVEH